MKSKLVYQELLSAGRNIVSRSERLIKLCTRAERLQADLDSVYQESEPLEREVAENINVILS